MTYAILRIIHICCITLWFAAPLGVGSLLKKGLATSPAAFRMSCELAAKRGKLSAIAGILTLLSGIAIIFHMGDFANAPVTMHIAIALVLIMLGLSIGVLKPLGGKLAAIATDEIDEAKRIEANAILKKLSMVSGISHSLWFIILVLMYGQ